MEKFDPAKDALTSGKKQWIQSPDGSKVEEHEPQAVRDLISTMGWKPVQKPKADAPKADAPKADAPKADAPKADAPKADAPKADAPKADAPAPKFKTTKSK